MSKRTRFYFESDGDAHSKSYYVIDTDSEPLVPGYRRDFRTQAEAIAWVDRHNNCMGCLDFREGHTCGEPTD